MSKAFAQVLDPLNGSKEENGSNKINDDDLFDMICKELELMNLSTNSMSTNSRTTLEFLIESLDEISRIQNAIINSVDDSATGNGDSLSIGVGFLTKTTKTERNFFFSNRKLDFLKRAQKVLEEGYKNSEGEGDKDKKISVVVHLSSTFELHKSSSNYINLHTLFEFINDSQLFRELLSDPFTRHDAFKFLNTVIKMVGIRQDIMYHQCDNHQCDKQECISQNILLVAIKLSRVEFNLLCENIAEESQMLEDQISQVRSEAQKMNISEEEAVKRFEKMVNIVNQTNIHNMVQENNENRFKKLESTVDLMRTILLSFEEMTEDDSNTKLMQDMEKLLLDLSVFLHDAATEGLSKYFLTPKGYSKQLSKNALLNESVSLEKASVVVHVDDGDTKLKRQDSIPYDIGLELYRLFFHYYSIESFRFEREFKAILSPVLKFFGIDIVYYLGQAIEANNLMEQVRMEEGGKRTIDIEDSDSDDDVMNQSLQEYVMGKKGLQVGNLQDYVMGKKGLQVGKGCGKGGDLKGSAKGAVFPPGSGERGKGGPNFTNPLGKKNEKKTQRNKVNATTLIPDKQSLEQRDPITTAIFDIGISGSWTTEENVRNVMTFLFSIIHMGEKSSDVENLMFRFAQLIWDPYLQWEQILKNYKLPGKETNTKDPRKYRIIVSSNQQSLSPDLVQLLPSLYDSAAIQHSTISTLLDFATKMESSDSTVLCGFSFKIALARWVDESTLNMVGTKSIQNVEDNVEGDVTMGDASSLTETCKRQRTLTDVRRMLEYQLLDNIHPDNIIYSGQELRSDMAKFYMQLGLISQCNK